GYLNSCEHIYKNKELGQQKKKFLRTEYHKTVVEWDAKTGQELRKLDRVRFEPEEAAFGAASGAWSPDGSMLGLAGPHNELEFVDVAAFKWADMGSAWAFSLSAMQFTPDGKHLFSPREGRIFTWDALTSKQLAWRAIRRISAEGKPTLSPEGQA